MVAAEDLEKLTMIGVALGGTALLLCLVLILVISKMYRQLSTLMCMQNSNDSEKPHRSITDKEKRKETKHEGESTKASTPNDPTGRPPAMCMLPLTSYQHDHGDQRASQPASESDSLESVSSESDNKEEPLRSPTVAELKNSLALPLKKVYNRSQTLDSRGKYPVCAKSGTLKDGRPRAMTGSALVSPDRPGMQASMLANQSESDSVLSTPGSTGSLCKNPQAYVVTEIVDVKDTKKRPSVRLRESRPRKQLSMSIKKQLEQPDPFYFSLESTGQSSGGESMEQTTTPSPTKKEGVCKIGKQVFPTAGHEEQSPPTPSDIYENNTVKGYSSISQAKETKSHEPEVQHKIAMKPPLTKARPPLVKSSSAAGLHRGTWSPRTLERHRMLLGEAAENSNGLGDRARAGSLREHFPRSMSPYELVQIPSVTSVQSVTCAEEVGCYSRMVRQPDGRRRASSIGAADISGARSDRAYNKLAVGM